MALKKMQQYLYVLAGIGVLLAIYLMWQQLYQPAFQPCTINATVNCDAVTKGPLANTFGIPTPLYGLVGYIGILIATYMKKSKTLLFLATFGLVFCMWIAYRELVDLRVICPVCIGCQTIMIVVFGLSVYVNKRKLFQHSK